MGHLFVVIDGGHDQAITGFKDFVDHQKIKEHQEHGEVGDHQEIDLDVSKVHQ